jgi:uncharacterized protein YdeI (YjbR/CyaY-like superfamily)
MKNTDSLPILLFETQQDWEAWLKGHHSEATGIWLKLAKKDVDIASLTYAEALESALCYGWIDGQKASFDHQCWLQKFTPRRPKSIWSQVNCEKATALIAAGRMQPAGLQQVELAKLMGVGTRLTHRRAESLSLPIFRASWTKTRKRRRFLALWIAQIATPSCSESRQRSEPKPVLLVFKSLSKCS